MAQLYLGANHHQNFFHNLPEFSTLPIHLAEVEVTDEDLVIDVGPETARTEEVDTVQVGDVHTPERKNIIAMRVMRADLVVRTSNDG